MEAGTRLQDMGRPALVSFDARKKWSLAEAAVTRVSRSYKLCSHHTAGPRSRLPGHLPPGTSERGLGLHRAQPAWEGSWGLRLQGVRGSLAFLFPSLFPAHSELESNRQRPPRVAAWSPVGRGRCCSGEGRKAGGGQGRAAPPVPAPAPGTHSLGLQFSALPPPLALVGTEEHRKHALWRPSRGGLHPSSAPSQLWEPRLRPPPARPWASQGLGFRERLRPFIRGTRPLVPRGHLDMPPEMGAEAGAPGEMGSFQKTEQGQREGQADAQGTQGVQERLMGEGHIPAPHLHAPGSCPGSRSMKQPPSLSPGPYPHFNYG